MDATTRKCNFSKLIKYLESLLQETNSEKAKLEEQCESAASILQPWKMETKSEHSKAYSESDNFKTESAENNSSEIIDSDTTEHIDKVIDKARTVRKQMKLMKEKNKTQQNQSEKKNSKMSLKSDGSENISQSSDISKHSKPIALKKSQAMTSLATSITKSKVPKNIKSPYCQTHFQTSYQKHFSNVGKNLVKHRLKTEPKDNTIETKNSNVREIRNLEPNLKQVAGDCDKIRLTKTLSSVDKSKSSSKTNSDFKVRKEDYKDSEEKSLADVINILELPLDLVYVLKLYHQYLNRIKSSNFNREAAFKEQFIRGFENLNNTESHVNSESESLLQEQIKKYLDLSKSLTYEGKQLPQANEPMFTSYCSIEKLKMLEKKHSELQKLKVQINLNNIMLDLLKTADVDETQTIPLYKTLTALSDITTLSIPIVIKND